MKNKLRKELKEKRKNLSKNEVLEKSKQIKNKLFEMDEFKHEYSILFYVSYGNEVYTHDMIKECLSIGKSVIVPYSDIKNRVLILSELKSWNELKSGSYGILEPRKDKIKEPSIHLIRELYCVPFLGSRLTLTTPIPSVSNQQGIKPTLVLVDLFNCTTKCFTHIIFPSNSYHTQPLFPEAHSTLYYKRLSGTELPHL